MGTSTTTEAHSKWPVDPIVLGGRVLSGQHIAGAWMQWARERIASPSTTAWERSFLSQKVEEAKRALPKAETR